MKKLIIMEEIVSAVKKNLGAKEMNAQGLFGVIDPKKIGAKSLDEGMLSDEIMESIERRREQLLSRIDAFVTSSQSKQIEKHAGSIGTEEIKATIRVILLEVEKLHAQTGSNCVRECSRMINELEAIHNKVSIEKKKHDMLYKALLGVVFLVLAGLVREVLVNNHQWEFQVFKFSDFFRFIEN